jgi:ATP-binding cassette subfamily B protein
MPPIKGDIRFEGVNFGYKEDQKVLKDFNLHIPAGYSVAIVGETGAGKTTIASLLLRFYEVGSGNDDQQSCGCIKIDGIDIRKVTQKSLRSQMAIVPQEPFLFSGSVYDNIRYGRLDATQKEIEDAAKAARAHEFILRLPQGYETNVGERGALLSLGQRQLISIARAILADPRILILDEATASVDTQTEMIIQQALTEC